MRFSSVSSILRTFYALSHFARVRAVSETFPRSYLQRTTIRSMPSIPFLGSLFSSTPASSKMSYPDERTKDEWRAVLSPREYLLLSSRCIGHID